MDTNKAEPDQPNRERERLLNDVRAIQDSVASLRDRDTRTPEEIVGYDDFGLPA